MNKSIIILTCDHLEIENRVIKEALYLKSRGCKVTVIVWDRSQSRKEPLITEKGGISVITFCHELSYQNYTKQPIAMLKYACFCRKYIPSGSVDFLHCQNLQGMLVGLLTCVFKNIKLVFDMREVYEKMYSSKYIRRLMRVLTQYAIRKSYAVVLVNKLQMDFIKPKYHGKTFLLPNYPTTVQFCDCEKTKSDILRVNYIGVMRNQVGVFQDIFEACKDFSDVHVRIHGAGMDYEKLLDISERYPNVSIAGSYDAFKDSARLYANTDILICMYEPDHQNVMPESTPIKMMEAIVTGTPILTSREMGFSSMICDKKLGFVIESHNIPKLRVLFDHLRQHKNELQEIQNNCLALKNQYSWENVVTILDSVFDIKDERVGVI